MLKNMKWLFLLIVFMDLNAYGAGNILDSTNVILGLNKMLNRSGTFDIIYMADGTSFSTAPSGGDVIGPSSSIDSEIAIYNSTTGKILKRFSGTGILKATSGVIGTATTTGTGDVVLATSPIFATQISTPSIISAGALGITPASGSNLNVNLAGTGDLAVNTNQLYVDTSSGNVGIGMTTPGAKLSVQNTSATATGLLLGNDNGTTGDYNQILFQHDQASNYFARTALRNVNTDGSVYGGQFQIWTDDSAGTLTQRVTINESGNVGIGTFSPIYKLSVNGTFGTYESYTDASNYSALKLSADSAGLKFVADQLGTGIANRPFIFLQTSSATGTGWDLQTGTGTSKVKWDVSGKQYDGVIGDSSASPGNATINTVSGKSAIAAGQTAMTLTNSNIATTSMIFISPLDVDATALSFKHSVSAGVGTITVNAAATATWKFAWKVIN